MANKTIAEFDPAVSITGADLVPISQSNLTKRTTVQDIIDLTEAGLGTLAFQDGTFSGSSTGTNTGDQNLFSTLSVSGQSNVVADSTSDTLTLVAGSNITITTDASTDTITIASSVTGVSDGDKGDVIVSSSGTVWTVDKPSVQGTGLTSDEVGFRIIPQNSKSAAYTTVAADSGKHIFHPSADTTARTFTIDSNANVAYPVGTAITFINQNGAGVVTIAITSDTMRLAGAGTTGSRTLAANGVATAVKVTSTEWIISGTGLT